MSAGPGADTPSHGTAAGRAVPAGMALATKGPDPGNVVRVSLLEMNSPILGFITDSLKLFHVNKRICRDVNLLHLFSFVPTSLCPPCVSRRDGTGEEKPAAAEELTVLSPS